MKRLVATLLVALLPFTTIFGCGYSVISSRTEVQDRNPTILAAQEEYRVDGMSLAGDELSLALGRDCFTTQEVNRDTLLVETREREMTGAWIALGAVAAVGLSVGLILHQMGAGDIMMNEDPLCMDWEDNCEENAAQAVQDGEDLQSMGGTVALVTLGLAAAGVATVLIMDGQQYEEETLLDRQLIRLDRDPTRCPEMWPIGRGSLLASTIGQEFDAVGDGAGRVTVDVSTAPVTFWNTGATHQLDLPGLTEWIPLSITTDIANVAMGRLGTDELVLALNFDDHEGDADGALDSGEIAHLLYEITNHSETTATDLRLDVSNGGIAGLDVEGPVDLGDLEPSQTVRGQLEVTASGSVDVSASVFEGSVTTTSGPAARDRIRVDIEVATGPARSYVWYDTDSEHADLLETGSIRLQTVLTRTGDYVFVSDTTTRERIERIVEEGGGSVEERLRNAVEAANQENIRKVYQLSINPIAGNHVQLVLAVYATGSTDRVFLSNFAVDLTQAMELLEGFDELGQAYLEWAEDND